MAKSFGAEVSWDAKTYTAKISRGDDMIEGGESFYKENDVYWLSRIINAERRRTARGNDSGGECGAKPRQAVLSDNIYDVIFDRNYGVQFSPTADNRIYETPSRST